MSLSSLSPWTMAGAVLVSLAGLLGTLGWWQRRCAPHPELVRKIAHVGMGLVTLTFPWIFRAVWPVWVLCAGSTALLAAARWWRPLRPAMGGALGRVERAGAGEFYFTLSVALVFTLAWGADPAGVLFVVPMLVLTLADAVGALVGVRYGQSRYTAGNGYKSVEGSLAFFIVAFFSTHVPLLLWAGAGRAESLLIGTLLGLLVMLMEAVCGYGTDNLFVPLTSFVALRIYLDLDVPALALRLAVLAGLTAVLLVWRRRTYLDDSAPLAAALVLYLCWSLGGWPWLVGPAALLVTYTLLCAESWLGSATLARARHKVDAVACVASAGLVWLFVARTTHWGEVLRFPFTVAFAAHAGMIALAHLRDGNRRPAGGRVVAEAAAVAGALVLVPFVLLDAHGGAAGLWQLGVGGVAVAAATGAFASWQERMDDCPTNTSRWLRQGVLGVASSLVGLSVPSA